MNSTSYAVLAGLITVAGRWSNGKPLDIKIAVGTAATAVGLTLVSNMDEDLASKLGLLIVIGAVFWAGAGDALFRRLNQL